MLLHDGRRARTGGLDGLSERLWYPLWDARVKMDHSVRTPAECTAVAAREVSAGVGLLDLRVVAGDGALVEQRPECTAHRVAHERAPPPARSCSTPSTNVWPARATPRTCWSRTSRRPGAASGT